MTTLPPEPNNGDSAAQQPGAPVPPPGAPTTPPSAPVPPPAPQPLPQGYQPPPQGYQPPPQQQPGQQQPQYAAPVDPAAQAASMVTLNYWLSVFFTWVPALIFYFIEKGKNPLADQYHRENLNFSLVRTAVMVATWIIGVIPYIGWILAALLWIGSVVLFVFHIIAAAKATENYKQGLPTKFIFNIDFVK